VPAGPAELPAGRDAAATGCGAFDEQGDLDAVVRPELGQEPRDVGFDGGHAHLQAGGDFGVGAPLADGRRHLELARGERRELALGLPLASRHVASGIGGAQLTAIIAGGGAATAVCAALGVGAGAVIRNQVGAVVTVLALLYVAVPLLALIPHVDPAVQQYGIDGLVAAATCTTGFPATARLLGQAPATAVLAGYAIAALLAGTALLRHRDITG
jgi:hypothetical protein